MEIAQSLFEIRYPASSGRADSWWSILIAAGSRLRQVFQALVLLWDSNENVSLSIQSFSFSPGDLKRVLA